eukprot:3865531-Prymnesium_polylepis.2
MPSVPLDVRVGEAAAQQRLQTLGGGKPRVDRAYASVAPPIVQRDGHVGGRLAIVHIELAVRELRPRRLALHELHQLSRRVLWAVGGGDASRGDGHTTCQPLLRVSGLRIQRDAHALLALAHWVLVLPLPLDEAHLEVIRPHLVNRHLERALRARRLLLEHPLQRPHVAHVRPHFENQRHRDVRAGVNHGDADLPRRLVWELQRWEAQP